MRRCEIGIVAVLAWTNLVGCDLEAYPNARSVYVATFNAPPGPGVTLLQAGGRSFRDSSNCYLRFHASPATLAALTGPVFQPMTRDEYLTQTRPGTNPDPIAPWWDPLKDNPTVFQRSAQFHPTHSQGQATLAYDPINQIANLSWMGID